MNDVLLFWRQRAELTLEPSAIAQELMWGEDVEGLVDLPIKEIIDRLKEEYPRHRETPGLLAIEFEHGRGEATWSWQHVKVELWEASDDDHRRLIAVLETFGCTAYEV